ncbi:FtsX-like permease family protein [Algoriphagus sp. AK58]|uniref:ABC transporter permease n=1 Tax=Algoriphagus sp. AK58 TaxID=1406877 RepID=UPI001650C460|nr:FtsX-like permease family protein [Algoriphagus sp. AK58]MBC6366202.1 ABC transporter permease [Algoriphagus sp. AK58]
MNLKMAWRNVWRNKTRSLIIMISVAIGLFAGLFVLGLYEGMMSERVRTVIDTEVAHLQVHHPEFKKDYDPKFTIDENLLENELKKIPEIKAFSNRVLAQGMLATTTGTSGVQIIGIDLEDEKEVSRVDLKVKEGELLDPGKKNGILISKKLAGKMKLKVGSKLVLTFTDIENTVTSGAFRVTGIYQTINTPLDERIVYVNRATLMDDLGLRESSHEIAVILNKDEDLDLVKNGVQAQFPQYSVLTWKENSPETELLVGTINQYSSIIIGIIMIALAFGIINTMLMSVIERTREIGMLTALGMNRKKIFLLILTETLILTLVGVPIGFICSWFSILYFSKTGIDISSFSEEAMSSFGFGSMIYPEFPFATMDSVLLIVFITALISALFPSWKAIKLQPADALRQ